VVTLDGWNSMTVLFMGMSRRGRQPDLTLEDSELRTDGFDHAPEKSAIDLSHNVGVTEVASACELLAGG
jgi:hypothetical protein